MTDAQLADKIRAAFTTRVDDRLAEKLAAGARRRLHAKKGQRTFAIAAVAALAASVVSIAVLEFSEDPKTQPVIVSDAPSEIRQTPPPSPVAGRKSKWAKVLEAKEKALKEKERQLRELERDLIRRERELQAREKRLEKPLFNIKPHDGKFKSHECLDCHDTDGFKSDTCDEVMCIIDPSLKCCKKRKKMHLPF